MDNKLDRKSGRKKNIKMKQVWKEMGGEKTGRGGILNV